MSLAGSYFMEIIIKLKSFFRVIFNDLFQAIRCNISAALTHLFDQLFNISPALFIKVDADSLGLMP
ncbi:MAG: hypothetical protein JWP78_1692 [Mucilaginibacter sp.]|nr:hypothetical protein [Mucilaginibacter sp.]